MNSEPREYKNVPPTEWYNEYRSKNKKEIEERDSHRKKDSIKFAEDRWD